MVDFLYGSRDSDDARTVLLRYYSSECMAHGAYLISIAVGLLGFIGALPHFWSIATFDRVVLLGLISSILATLAIHVLGRAFFWGYLAFSVLFVVSKKESEIRVEEGTAATSLILLHRACFDYVLRKHWIAKAFDRVRMWEIGLWLVLIIGFSLGWLVLSL